MGIDYRAALVVGLPWSDFDENDDLEGWVDDEKLERFATEYDADSPYCVYGIKYARTSDYDDINYSVTSVLELKDRFFDITGRDGRLILTLDVS